MIFLNSTKRYNGGRLKYIQKVEQVARILSCISLTSRSNQFRQSREYINSPVFAPVYFFIVSVIKWEKIGELQLSFHLWCFYLHFDFIMKWEGRGGGDAIISSFCLHIPLSFLLLSLWREAYIQPRLNSFVT